MVCNVTAEVHYTTQISQSCLHTVFPSYLTILPDHDVVTMAIPNSQNISSYTVACTRQCELLDGLIQFIPVGKRDTISLCLLLHSWHFSDVLFQSNVQCRLAKVQQYQQAKTLPGTAVSAGT